MTDLLVHRYPGRDGLQLAYRELGTGRPLLLLHGFITDWTLWTDFGPAKAIVAGQGFEACTRIRNGQNRRTLTALVNGTELEPGSPEAQQAYWIKQSHGDPRALLNILDAQVPTPESALPPITTPVLVAVGDQDHEHASADALAAALPDSRFTRVPGNHFTAIGSPEFAAAVTDFLTRHGVVARQGNA